MFKLYVTANTAAWAQASGSQLYYTEN